MANKPQRGKTKMKMLLWKICSCNLRAWADSHLEAQFTFFFFFTVFTRMCACVRAGVAPERDPMLSMCARETACVVLF